MPKKPNKTLELEELLKNIEIKKSALNKLVKKIKTNSNKNNSNSKSDKS